MPREWGPSRNPSQMISASISIDLSFLLRPTWLGCLYPYLSTSLVFSPWDWLSYMTRWQWATASSQNRAHFSGNPAWFPEPEDSREGKSRVGRWQVLTAYRDLGALACICSQKHAINYMQFLTSTHIFCKCTYLHIHFLEYNNLAHSDKVHRYFYITFS